MKKIIEMALAVLVFIVGCGQSEVFVNNSSAESASSQAGALNSSRMSATSSNQSTHEIVGNNIFESYGNLDTEIPEDLYSLIPERAAPVKDDAYWAALLNDVGETYLDESTSLEDKFLIIACSLELSFINEYNFDEIKKGGIGCYDDMIYAAFGLATHEEKRGEGDGRHLPIFFKEELFDKYVYYLFNQKVDFMKVTGYSPKQAGVWADEIGYGGGGRWPVIDSIEETGDGNYTVLMTFVDEEDNHPLWKSEYKFTVEGRRIIINSIEILEIYDLDWFYPNRLELRG